MESIRKATREYAYDIYRDKRKGESFSNVDPSEFFLHMNIDINDVISTPTIPGIIHVDTNDSKLVSLANTLTTVYDAEGHPSIGNESKRSDFVQPFLTCAISRYNRRTEHKVRLEREYTIENELYTGQVEFVITNKMSRCVLVTIEVKKQDWDLGRAQNILEMFVSHSANTDKGLPESHIVYGCLSTGDLWELYSYEGFDKGWKYYGRLEALKIDDIRADIVFDIGRVRKLLEIISYMIEHAMS